MWDNVGIIRSGKDLKRMVEILAAWHRIMSKPTDRRHIRAGIMIITARLMTEAALTRTGRAEGAHFHTDFPEPPGMGETHHIQK